MDASLVIAYCDKELAAGTFKGTGGHHPLEAWCDNTGESLALLPRKGSAGSDTATDHLTVLDEAIIQIPARYRRDQLVTVDGAGASHGLVDHITTLNASPRRRVHYSIGWELGARERTAIELVPASAWAATVVRCRCARQVTDVGACAQDRSRRRTGVLTGVGVRSVGL